MGAGRAGAGAEIQSCTVQNTFGAGPVCDGGYDTEPSICPCACSSSCPKGMVSYWEPVPLHPCLEISSPGLHANSRTPAPFPCMSLGRFDSSHYGTEVQVTWIPPQRHFPLPCDLGQVLYCFPSSFFSATERTSLPTSTCLPVWILTSVLLYHPRPSLDRHRRLASSL